MAQRRWWDWVDLVKGGKWRKRRGHPQDQGHMESANTGATDPDSRVVGCLYLTNCLSLLSRAAMLDHLVGRALRVNAENTTICKFPTSETLEGSRLEQFSSHAVSFRHPYLVDIWPTTSTYSMAAKTHRPIMSLSVITGHFHQSP